MKLKLLIMHFKKTEPIYYLLILENLFKNPCCQK